MRSSTPSVFKVGIDSYRCHLDLGLEPWTRRYRVTVLLHDTPLRFHRQPEGTAAYRFRYP